eukprot:COSAG01_NODE_11802_length_1855_cov_2.051793_3_plen_94_part_00
MGVSPTITCATHVTSTHPIAEFLHVPNCNRAEFAELTQKLGAPVSPPRICARIVDSSYEVAGFARPSNSRASLWSAAYVLCSSYTCCSRPARL